MGWLQWCVWQAGDLIYTGTPAGVGALQVGDAVVARVSDLPECRFTIGANADDDAPPQA